MPRCISQALPRSTVLPIGKEEEEEEESHEIADPACLRVVNLQTLMKRHAVQHASNV